MAAREIEVPEWLVPGAQVVLWKEGRYSFDDNPEAVATTVKTVGKMWINIEGLDEKLRIDTLRSKDLGGKWHHWRYRIVECGSAEGVKMLNRTNMINAKDAATQANREWEKDIYNRERIIELRDALDRFDDALKLFRSDAK